MKDSWGERVLGGEVLGFVGFLRRGEFSASPVTQITSTLEKQVRTSSTAATYPESSMHVLLFLMRKTLLQLST